MPRYLSGRVWKYGDNVDTDAIIPARYLSMTEPKSLARHCLEHLDPGFAAGVKAGDIVVAGKNFGCGSSREHAPLALLGAGVAAVVAEGFARIFYRNAINVGLPILEAPEAAMRAVAGDRMEIDLGEGIISLGGGADFHTKPFPPFLADIIASGGLIAYARKRLEEKT